MNTIDLVWILASLASTLIGWWLARELIASRRAADQREREEAAVVDLERAMSLRDVDEARRDVRALLATRRSLLPIEAADAADEWLAENGTQVAAEVRRVLDAAEAVSVELQTARDLLLSEAQHSLVHAIGQASRWYVRDPRAPSAARAKAPVADGLGSLLGTPFPAGSSEELEWLRSSAAARRGAAREP